MLYDVIAWNEVGGMRGSSVKIQLADKVRICAASMVTKTPFLCSSIYQPFATTDNTQIDYFSLICQQ